jgi:hypothetical protein
VINYLKAARRTSDMTDPMMVADRAVAWNRPSAEFALPSLVDPRRSCWAAPRPLEVASTDGSTDIVILVGLPVTTVVGNV